MGGIGYHAVSHRLCVGIPMFHRIRDAITSPGYPAKESRGVKGRPILVTGAPRSGTTWIGKMIAASPIIGYINEPFGLLRHSGICGIPHRYWYPYISRHNEELFFQPVNKMLAYEFNWSSAIRGIRKPRDIRRTVTDWNSLKKLRTANTRALIKDPNAIFCAEWLAKAFDMNVVIVVRHPGAVASSLKQLGWLQYISDLLRQTSLVQDHLGPFRKELEFYSSGPHSTDVLADC